jgi:uncharacterized membrane protein
MSSLIEILAVVLVMLTTILIGFAPLYAVRLIEKSAGAPEREKTDSI